MTTPIIQTSLAAGEIAPALFGHVDLAKFHTAATTMRNLAVNYRGGANSRAGTAYVIQSLTTPAQNIPPRVITFRYSVTQSFCLEVGFNPTAGQGYIAFYSGGSPIIEAPLNITGASQANPCVLTVPGHGYSTNDRVSVAGVNGMTPLNGRFFTVTVIDANNISLAMLNGTAVDSTGFPAYVSGGTCARLYKIAAPWALGAISALKFAQSADVMSITHPAYPSYDLARITDNDWTLTATVFENTVAPPGAPAIYSTALAKNVSTTPPQQPTTYGYVLTAVNNAGQESIASGISQTTESVDMATYSASQVLRWRGVAGAAYYNIYRAGPLINTLLGSSTDSGPVPVGSIFSYVGTALGTEFTDANITPDFTQSPPLSANPFAPGQITNAIPAAVGAGYTAATVSIVTSTGSGAVILASVNTQFGTIDGYYVQEAGEGYVPGDYAVVSGDGSGAACQITIGPQTGTYPSVVGYIQQRRTYANSYNQPDTYWMSKPGHFTDFSTSNPVQANDAVTGTPWAQQVDGIQWMLQEPGGMLVFTGGGLWQVNGSGGSALNPVAITPSSQQAQPQLFSGASATVQPIQIYSDVLFVTSKGNSVRSATYNYFSNNWSGADQTVLSSHLFLGWDINSWTWCEEPYKIVWATRCDGILLSYTYLKEQEVYGWARHDTAGAFLYVTSVSEPPVDALYCVTQRNTPSGSFYFIERFDDRIWKTNEDPWCVDAGVANQLGFYSASLTATSASGPVSFVAASDVFTAGMVGAVLRVSGGIANLTSFTDAQHMSGTWVLPPAFAVEAPL